LFFAFLLASIDTQSFGIFFQKRIGRYGKPFLIYKFKTFHPKTNQVSTLGSFFRNYKIDEWPQLINVLKGDMSVVGPRPDVPGYYDVLEGEARKIIQLRPGLTSEAAIKYRNEEALLVKQSNPAKYNDEVIFPDKVRMNLHYFYNHSFKGDLQIIWRTIFSGNTMQSER
jgi:lipopolysaccharide/colanic/teichoic acid biosynthesis glycosyltransferase